MCLCSLEVIFSMHESNRFHSSGVLFFGVQPLISGIRSSVINALRPILIWFLSSSLTFLRSRAKISEYLVFHFAALSIGICFMVLETFV